MFLVTPDRIEWSSNRRNSDSARECNPEEWPFRVNQKRAATDSFPPSGSASASETSLLVPAMLQQETMPNCLSIHDISSRKIKNSTQQLLHPPTAPNSKELIKLLMVSSTSSQSERKIPLISCLVGAFRSKNDMASAANS